MEQNVRPDKLKPLQAILVILGVVAFLFLAQFILSFVQYTVSYLANRIELYVGNVPYTVASVLYWVIGGVVALRFLRNYVLTYRYTANTRQLRIERIYGEGRPRFVTDVFFHKLLSFGTPEEVLEKHPDGKKLNATVNRADLPKMALAHETTDGVQILLFQPNAELTEMITAALREH